MMSSSLVVGGIKVSGDRDPKISSARTTLHAAWAICSRAVSVACASSASGGQSCDTVKCYGSCDDDDSRMREKGLIKSTRASIVHLSFFASNI